MVFTATGDEPMTITSTILRVEPPMLLEHTHVDADSSMRWELEPVDGGCVLRLTHFVTDPTTAMRTAASTPLSGHMRPRKSAYPPFP